ncbi:hypothetical protein Nmel_012517 [Mimus melanotis]
MTSASGTGRFTGRLPWSGGRNATGPARISLLSA